MQAMSLRSAHEATAASLHVRVTAAGSVDDPVVVDCHFAHEKIFDHYQQINRGFWQHENLPTLPVRKKGIPLPALLA